MKRLAAKGAGLAERRSAGLPPHQQEGVRRGSRDRGFPSSELEFPGCYAVPMTRTQYEAHEGRVEFFDSRPGVAWIVREPMRAPHEEPRFRLVELLVRIGQLRGSPIRCLGETGIHWTHPVSGRFAALYPDQMLFLHPHRAEGEASRHLEVGGADPYPDVVLEVDTTTDVRQNRLKLYEEWGFPELWVEVPEAYVLGRPSGLRFGLRIYLLEEGRYVQSEESPAFAGWRAAEIHRGLNEPVLSEETSAALSRVGRALGERDGTGPEDDLLLREQRSEARIEGRAEGRAMMIRALLGQRGIAVPPDFPPGLAPRNHDALRAASEDRILAAVSAANSFADFLARLDDPGS